MGQACPGCGREYTKPYRLCPCGYAASAVRWAERPLAPPEDWLAAQRVKRAAREALERRRAQEALDRKVREAAEALSEACALQDEIARRRAASNQGAKRVVTPEPPPQPKSTETQPPPPAPATKKHRKTTEPVGPHQPQLPPEPLPILWRRIAHTQRLAAESRFLDQRTEAAHRNFLKLLDRVWPETDHDPDDWTAPLGWPRRHDAA